ncbi:uncharacterized protein LOC133196344 [Saccostrea echinata]|uniref:uncharacterized protein LOC133196344 n=1 Tax=Saccostrea echinata TaxID=191078 RepID=UPI002A7EEB59|nr:uncharacterized protein LOC133196344 [Saccostrea echinata]
MQRALQNKFQGKASEPQSIQYDIKVLSEIFEKEIRQLEEENKRYAIKLAAYDAENEKEKKECEALKREILKKNVEIQEVKSEHSTNTGKYGTLKGEAKKEVQRLRKEMEELRHKLGHVNEEKNYWVRRISEIAGAKMTDGNAQITDLSDPNRPIKLAERFGELYDACWTDVLEEFMIHHSKGTTAEEKKAIEGLKTLLEDCHDACSTLSRSLAENTRKALMLQEEHITPALSHEINSLRKLASQKNIGNIKKICKEEVMSKSTSCVKQLKSADFFIDECIDVCWFMVIQDPPLVFYYPEETEGQEFNTKRFQFYTRSGTKLEYVVWPALLLNKGGNLLRKGIAEPVEEKKKKGKLKDA